MHFLLLIFFFLYLFGWILKQSFLSLDCCMVLHPFVVIENSQNWRVQSLITQWLSQWLKVAFVGYNCLI